LVFYLVIVGLYSQFELHFGPKTVARQSPVFFFGRSFPDNPISQLHKWEHINRYQRISNVHWCNFKKMLMGNHISIHPSLVTSQPYFFRAKSSFATSNFKQSHRRGDFEIQISTHRCFLCYKPSKKYHVDLFHPPFKGSHPHLYSIQRFSMENQPPFFWESGDGLLPFAQATGFSARAAGGWHSYPLHRGVFAIYQGWTGKN